ncbi:MAG: DUF2141 domain-containing protein [Treponema sp.]|nr:DUF2141 domain-containing protein [Treponema sp.]
MFRKALLFIISFFVTGNIFAVNIQVTIVINGITVNRGLLYVAVYSNENDYNRERAFISFTLQPTNTRLTHSLELPAGEYVVSIFQDTNNDGRLNTNLFGVPTEPVGKTNYNLSGRAGNFNSLRVPVNNNSRVLTVNMGRVRVFGII